jgi:hypothetical protein
MIQFNEEHEIFPVLNMYIAGELMTRGFALLRTEPNKKDERLNVFIFKNTPEFVDAMNEVIEQRRKSREKR